MSPLEADLAILLARGFTRTNAGAQLGLTVHQAKAALKSVFEKCGVANAADLARFVVEVSTLLAITTACHLAFTSTDSDRQPFRLLPRRGREGGIAVRDYGPIHNHTVLIFHANSSGGQQVGRFITDLQATGFRPISIERGGYGHSTFLHGDPVHAAVEDIADVLHALAIRSAPAITLGTVAALVACAAQNAGLVTGGVIINPDGPGEPNPEKGYRSMKLLKSLAVRSPEDAALFVRIIYHSASPKAFEQSLLNAAKDSAADMSVFADPACLGEVVSATRQAAGGERGPINELRFTWGAKPEPVPDSSVWTLLYGAQDATIDFEKSLAAWRSFLPSARNQTLPVAGHWLHLSHTLELARALMLSGGPD
jgi:pimeloyl-ACP methyl ester carboxylesterase